MIHIALIIVGGKSISTYSILFYAVFVPAPPETAPVCVYDNEVELLSEIFEEDSFSLV